jgi:hypothetical protein
MRNTDGSAHGHALALATGEGLGLAVQVLLQIQQAGGLLDLLGDLGLVHAAQLEREAHVLGHGHVRVQRVGLEHHGDVPALRRDVGDVAAADQDAALVDVLQAGEHAQRRGLARARGTDQDEKLAVRDLQVQGVHRAHRRATRVDPRRSVVLDVGHESSRPSIGSVVGFRHRANRSLRLSVPTLTERTSLGKGSGKRFPDFLKPGDRGRSGTAGRRLAGGQVAPRWRNEGRPVAFR